MIPVLWSETETEFGDNIICHLGECITCRATEGINDIYEVEFQYPVWGKYFAQILEGRFIGTTHDDKSDVQPFEIYKRSAPIDGIVTFYAHHLSYKASRVVVKPIEGASPAGIFNALPTQTYNNCPFTFWTTKSGNTQFESLVPTSLRSILLGKKDSLVDTFGGEFEFNKWQIKWHGERGSQTDVTIRYGKNLTDLEQTSNSENLYNAIVPYWSGKIEGIDVLIMPDEGQEVVTLQGVTNPRPIVKDLTSDFKNAPDPADLISRAREYLTNDQPWVPTENLKINFTHLWQTEEYKNVASLQRVALGDKVSVYYPELGVTAENFEVVKVVYNVLEDKYDQMELGMVTKNFMEKFKEDYDKQIEETVKGFESILESEIKHATELLMDPGDSHVIFAGIDENGVRVYGNGTVRNPQEILIMNSTNPATATQILRINKNGIGFADNINGPYRSAWTLDGHFVADFITAGTINGNLIRAGILSDFNQSTYTLTNDRSLVPGKAYYIRALVPNYDATLTYAIGDLVRRNGTVYKCTTVINEAESWTSSHWTTASSQDYTYVRVNTPMPNELGSYYEVTNNHRNYWNLETGEFSLSAAATVGGETIASQQDLSDLSDDIHDDMDELESNINSDMISMEERLTPEELTQQRVFNALTNNGQTMGIWLKASDNKLYINASYIATGVLADANNNTIFSLETGKLTMNKGSINISNRFIVSESGYLTCSGASIEGEFKAGSSYWIKLNSSGELCGGYGNNQYGYIDFSANVWDIPMQQYLKGIQIQGDILRINTYRIAAAQSTNVGTTTYSGGNGTLRVIYDVFYDSNGVVQGRIKDYTVINGLICSEFDW